MYSACKSVWWALSIGAGGAGEDAGADAVADITQCKGVTVAAVYAFASCDTRHRRVTSLPDPSTSAVTTAATAAWQAFHAAVCSSFVVGVGVTTASTFTPSPDGLTNAARVHPATARASRTAAASSTWSKSTTTTPLCSMSSDCPALARRTRPPGVTLGSFAFAAVRPAASPAAAMRRMSAI